jgi:hypothetical protein
VGVRTQRPAYSPCTTRATAGLHGRSDIAQQRRLVAALGPAQHDDRHVAASDHLLKVGAVGRLDKVVAELGADFNSGALLF